MTSPDPGAPESHGRGSPPFGPRAAARLAAVQALYQIDASGHAPQTVIGEFLNHRVDPAVGDPELPGPSIAELIEDGRVSEIDTQLFADVVRSGAARQSGEMIAGALVEGWTLERLDSVLRAIMRAGIGELTFRPDIPPEVTVNEYVQLSHGFFSGKEPGMVNGVLDRLAKLLRGDEAEPS